MSAKTKQVARASSFKVQAIREQDAPSTVPKLRFPEFRGAEGWDVEMLGGICQPQQWSTISSADLVYQGYPVYGANGFVGYYTDFNHEFETVAVTCRGSTCGEVSLIPAKSYITGNSMCLDGIDAGQNSYHFVYQLLKHRGFSDVISGSAQPQIVGNVIKKLRIALPKLTEQQKIAECLSSVDEVIAAQGRKVEALKTHKKGLMQQLFPREGETQPRLRFPEFQNAEEWRVRKLSQFITERNEYPTEKVPLFSLTIEDGVTPKTQRYERSFLVNDERDAYKLVNPNDFAFNPMNLRFGAIGRHSGTEKVAVSKYYNIFSCDQTVDPRFCETYFRSDRMIAYYDEMAIGSLIEKRRVHFAAFLKFDIRFPDLPEQQRIASCLSNLDDLIAAETKKLEALKLHKRGLMQQLFPSLESG